MASLTVPIRNLTSKSIIKCCMHVANVSLCTEFIILLFHSVCTIDIAYTIIYARRVLPPWQQQVLFVKNKSESL